MTTTIPQEHVLFVHAHPDDETISTGGTIATLLDAGAMVTLVTCTRGERGEVIPRELRHLSGDALGAYRATELASAMRELGLTDYRFLGEGVVGAEGSAVHRYLDSGMQWGLAGAEPLEPLDPLPPSSSSSLPQATLTEATLTEATLTEANFDVLVTDLTSVIAEVKATAVVSYDERGGYGHPDHKRAHEVAVVAALMMDVPFYSIVAQGQAQDTDIHVDVRAVIERKTRALQAYRTQLTVVGDTVVHSGGQREPIATVEVFRARAARPESELNWRDLGAFARIASCAFAFLLGCVVGIVGTVNHEIAGAAVSLLLAAGLLVGLRLLLNTRIVAASAALGMLLVVGIFSLESPGGSVLIQANQDGYVWSYALPVIALVVLAWPSIRKRSRDSMEKKSEPGEAVAAS